MNLDNLNFNDETLKKYQEEITNLKKLCDDAVSDKSLQKTRKRYLKLQLTDNMKVLYNKIENTDKYEKIPLNVSSISINTNKYDSVMNGPSIKGYC